MFNKPGWLILILAVCVSCGKGSPTKTDYTPPSGPQYSPIYLNSDTFFDDHIDEFKFQYQKYNNAPFLGEISPINFHDLSTLSYLSKQALHIEYSVDAANNQSTMAAVCLSYSNGKREILIDINAWNTIGQGVGCNGACYERKQALVFHEMGHCLLNRDHKDEKHDSFNLSIMNSSLISQSSYARWSDDYLEELFTEDHRHVEESIDYYRSQNP